MLLFVLSVLAMIFLYMAIRQLISSVFQYKYAGLIAHTLQDADTRKLFVYLRPYMVDYINLIRKNVGIVAKNSDTYRDYIHFVKKYGRDKPKSK